MSVSMLYIVWQKQRYVRKRDLQEIKTLMLYNCMLIYIYVCQKIQRIYAETSVNIKIKLTFAFAGEIIYKVSCFLATYNDTTPFTHNFTSFCEDES